MKTHSTWDTGKTLCGRDSSGLDIDDWEPTCKKCCRVLDYHFADEE